jgi:lipoprotein-anchoring transpeptidase ErfK/SrfK
LGVAGGNKVLEFIVVFGSLLLGGQLAAQSATVTYQGTVKPWQLASAKATTVSSFAKKRAALGKRVFIFDPKTHRWAAYDEQGRLVKSGRASGGRNYCPDIKRGCRTPVGRFAVYHKGSAGCKSSKYPVPRGGAPMPYCMFFRGGYAIHGSSDVPDRNASHGCIRVEPHMAKWLSNEFIRNGVIVIVQSY